MRAKVLKEPSMLAVESNDYLNNILKLQIVIKQALKYLMIHSAF